MANVEMCARGILSSCVMLAATLITPSFTLL